MTTGGTGRALGRYRRMTAAAVAAVYFLILVGASVRASGAGMGCPDWPTCFGRWVPPTHESQLPGDYQEIYADLGYAETRFNAVKTWTEYLNRLTGAAVGLMILAAAALSWPLRRVDRGVFLASAGAFLLVCLQGWLGAMVVRSNLLPGMVTAHMMMAMAIVAVLLFALERARRGPAGFAVGPRLEKWLWALLAMVALQMVLGTQVREMTDLIRQAQGEALRARWIEAMPWFFYVHRSFSALVLLTGLCLAWLLPRDAGPARRLGLAAAPAAAAATGAALGHLGMPAAAQPLHLLAAAALFGLVFALCARCRLARRLADCRT